jgi:hypothetical protein
VLLLKVKADSRKLKPGTPATFPALVGSSNDEAEAWGRHFDFMVSTGLATPNFLALITTYTPPDCLCCLSLPPSSTVLLLTLYCIK